MEIRRGDVVICAAPGEYGKPRPALVVQSELFNGTHSSVTVCLITSPPGGRASLSLSCACRENDRSESAVAGDG
jgi:mRNA-degrading endonuclease toxin of MazEF toxin-antitoxin module